MPSAVRYKNWKMYFAMASEAATGGLMPGSRPSIGPWSSTSSAIRSRRRRFEPKTLLGQGGALAGPVTAYIYDWNMLPIGQVLWLKELESYEAVPAAAGSPASYNLDQVIAEVQEQMKRTRGKGD